MKMLAVGTSMPEIVNNPEMWNAVLARDASRDGSFVFAVKSTGIYCRPSCPARRPRREQVSFFQLPEAAEQEGFRACKRCHPRRAESTDARTELVRRICHAIDEHDAEPQSLKSLSEEIGISAPHLQRTFKEMMGITPRQYAESRRLTKFKTNIKNGSSVTAAMYDAGYGSSRALYEKSATQLGMTPATYGRGGKGMRIIYTITSCPLGRLLVGATERGVCSVALGDSDAELIEALFAEYPNASIDSKDTRISASLNVWLNRVLEHLHGRSSRIDLPLDIQATAFQIRVWQELQRIPLGETQSYQQIAAAIGKPKAVRAVARACASNHVALVIPCHRVIREDKSLGGYRWGLERKRKLLQREKSADYGDCAESVLPGESS
ncbi:MAG TPA: bifunctional DNA-binding transcriptional regulator/O6-methylguanine-DNA methyltransferase Ada [Pyrinomonadaceae bacterium]|jgi:AraC family transcriptional regulator of adaptative response/methylated-DNA-[protein]-cysteine methyltransferase|nr:bifunctional DNA-binding transcriptional regulator/O6-methylguanine-DNA methyltransferase Ada [Pyrinomonadaceae bacterium]